MDWSDKVADLGCVAFAVNFTLFCWFCFTSFKHSTCIMHSLLQAQCDVHVCTCTTHVSHMYCILPQLLHSLVGLLRKSQGIAPPPRGDNPGLVWAQLSTVNNLLFMLVKQGVHGILHLKLINKKSSVWRIKVQIVQVKMLFHQYHPHVVYHLLCVDGLKWLFF